MDDDGWIMAVSEIHKKCSLSIVLSLRVQILATEALNILPKILRRYGWSFWVCQTIPSKTHHPIKNPPFFLVFFRLHTCWLNDWFHLAPDTHGGLLVAPELGGETFLCDVAFGKVGL